MEAGLHSRKYDAPPPPGVGRQPAGSKLQRSSPGAVATAAAAAPLPSPQRRQRQLGAHAPAGLQRDHEHSQVTAAQQEQQQQSQPALRQQPAEQPAAPPPGFGGFLSVGSRKAPPPAARASPQPGQRPAGPAPPLQPASMPPQHKQRARPQPDGAARRNSRPPELLQPAPPAAQRTRQDMQRLASGDLLSAGSLPDAAALSGLLSLATGGNRGAAPPRQAAAPPPAVANASARKRAAPPGNDAPDANTAPPQMWRGKRRRTPVTFQPPARAGKPKMYPAPAALGATPAAGPPAALAEQRASLLAVARRASVWAPPRHLSRRGWAALMRASLVALPLRQLLDAVVRPIVPRSMCQPLHEGRCPGCPPGQEARIAAVKVSCLGKHGPVTLQVFCLSRLSISRLSYNSSRLILADPAAGAAPPAAMGSPMW